MSKYKIAFVLFTTVFFLNQLHSQTQETSSGNFDVNKMFVGGNIVFGLGGVNGSNNFTIGGNPEIGYSILKNFDAGLCFNVISQSGSYFESNINRTINYKNFNFGAGIFTRIHLSDGFFIQAQPEFNNIKYKQSASGYNDLDTTLKSTSFLVGAGWGTRKVGNANFFTLVLIDLENKLYSPYRNSTGGIIPQFRAGFNYYFGQKKKR